MKFSDFFRKNKSISAKKFKDETYQKELLAKAQTWYFENNQAYELVSKKLREEGLDKTQVAFLLEKLKQLNQNMTETFKEELDSGKVRVKIDPNQEALKSKEAVDKLIGFGAFQMDNGDFDNALELFDQAIELDDKATLAYANKGSLYSKKGDQEQSLFFYNKALEIEPSHKEVLQNKASLLQGMGKMEEAIIVFKTILEHHPNDLVALNDLGIYYGQKNQIDIALTYFERLLGVQPNDQDALYNTLHAFCVTDIEKAKSFHKKNLAHIQNDSLHHFVSTHLDQKGQREAAIQHYEELYQLTNDDKYIKLKGHFFYARNPEKAVEIYDQYLLRHPNDEEVKNFKSQLVGTPESEALFNFLYKYRMYIVRFATNQLNGNFSPIGAYEKSDGTIEGFLYYFKEQEIDFSAHEAVNRMRIEFEQRLRNQSIKSYTIYYHSQFNHDGNHRVADENFSAISIQHRVANEPEIFTAIPYSFNGQQYNFHITAGLTYPQHQQIWSTQLEPNKNYFEGAVELKKEDEKNEAGLEVRKKYEGRVGDLWKGIVGVVQHAEMVASNSMFEFIAVALANGSETEHGKICVTDWKDSAIHIKVVSEKETKHTITSFPVIKTKQSIPVKNKYINEWAHVDNVEARIQGNGRDIFRVGYYATDYATNRDKYLANINLNIKLSGIILSLDIHQPDPNDTQMSSDFCGYVPYENGSEDCFNFVGIVKDFKATNFMESPKFGGYILTVKLINHPEIEDFFTIDMFVSKNNMNFEEVKIGMQLTGLVLFQGGIEE